MTFTYTGPGVDDVSTVRFHIGDTEEDYAHLSDEEIQYLIDQWIGKNGSLVYVAAMAARSLADKYAREVNVSGDGISLDVGALQQKFTELHRSLIAQYKALPKDGVGGPEVGGIKYGETRDPSVIPPDFGVGMHDNPQAGNQGHGDAPYVYPERPVSWP